MAWCSGSLDTSSTTDAKLILRCTQVSPMSSDVPGVPSQQMPRSVASITHAPRGLETLLQWSVMTPDNATTITGSFILIRLCHIITANRQTVESIIDQGGGSPALAPHEQIIVGRQ